MPYTPLQVANTFLRNAEGSSTRIDPMKAQKLDYFVHGWWLAYNQERLLKEQPQVWKYGPVFPSLYRELRPYGNSDLPGPIRVNPFSQDIPLVPDDDANAKALIEWVWGRYGHLSALALSELTHKPGTAWHTVAVAHDFRVPNGFPLPDDAVRAEFAEYKKQLSA